LGVDGVSNQAFTVEKGSRVKCITSLKTYNVKKVSKPPMSKISVSESENADNTQRDSAAP